MLSLAISVMVSVPYVGVVDDIWANDEWASGPPLLHGRCLSTIFVKQKEGWRDAWSGLGTTLPADTFEPAKQIVSPGTASERKTTEKILATSVNWTLTFDSRKIGSYDGTVAIAPQCQIDFPIPMKKRAAEYLGWGGAGDSSRPAYRPNVAVTTDKVSDPERWRPAELSQVQLDVLLATWRIDFQKLNNCKGLADSKAPSLTVTHSYVSKATDRLVFFKPTGRNYCDPDDPSGYWKSVVYAWTPGSDPRLIGTSLFPVDAGDYDGDGKSEWLMFASYYNLDGYVIFSDRLQRSAVSVWSYQ